MTAADRVASEAAEEGGTPEPVEAASIAVPGPTPYHAHESVTFSSDIDTPLGCKRCGELLRHPIHGLPPKQKAAP